VSEPIYAQRYRLVEALPPGRALAVHRALDTADRPMIITVLRPADADAFIRHMGTVAAARHLDLAVVVDVGRDGADTYVVTEDVQGADAAALVARGPLPVGVASMIGAEAAAGLAALHGHGATHGGVAPDAVVQAGDGTVKLTGAGLAAACPPLDLSAMAPGAAAQYLSPEEAAGGAATPASDVYRLGLVLYLLLTGTPLFEGADAATVAREQLDGVAQPPQFRNPEVPPALAQVVMRALDKDPARRGSAAQLQDDLERVLGTAQVQVTPEPEKPRSKAWIWITAVLVLALVAVGVAWAAGAFGGGDEPQPKQVTVPDATGMTQQGARTALEHAGLKVGDVVTVESTKGPAGTVVAQDPPAGKVVPENTVVSLTLAMESTPTPPPTGAVPDVTGMDQAGAKQALLDAGFVVIVNEAPSASVAAGTVISQAPVAGVMAKTGASVTIVVSTGPTATPSASP
jgi:eukaryotic-like serine/threonine-protein kinase